jgi:uncharacterized protein (TIGR00106 family)
MLADLTIIPIGRTPHTSETLAAVLKIIKDSGLSYQLTPTSTCIEGNWDEIMAVVRQCHEIARDETPHVVTLLKLESDDREVNKLRTNIESVEEQAGEALATEPPPPTPVFGTQLMAM